MGAFLRSSEMRVWSASLTPAEDVDSWWAWVGRLFTWGQPQARKLDHHHLKLETEITNYQAGAFSGIHNDCFAGRLLSYNLHLATPGWKEDWGGGYFWCGSDLQADLLIPVGFN